MECPFLITNIKNIAKLIYNYLFKYAKFFYIINF